MWKAKRCALFGPMPGSRPNSSMRSCIAPSYIGSEAWQAQAAAQATHATADRAHLLLGELANRLGDVVHRRENKVLQRFDVFGVDHRRIDPHRPELARSGSGDGDERAAGRARNLGLGQLGLSLRELLLHPLRLFHELLQVGLSAWPHGALLRSLARPVHIPTGPGIIR